MGVVKVRLAIIKLNINENARLTTKKIISQKTLTFEQYVMDDGLVILSAWVNAVKFSAQCHHFDMCRCQVAYARCTIVRDIGSLLDVVDRER